MDNKTVSLTETSVADTLNLASKSSSSLPIATNIPLEIFANICKYLQLFDLSKLTRVCKQYRIYLMSPANQDIWRTSRLEFLSYPKLLPEGMTEQDFFKLTSTMKGCQFCGTRNSQISLHWEFRVRCCDECYQTKAIELTKDADPIEVDGQKIPEELKSCLSYKDSPYRNLHWLQVDSLYLQLCKTFWIPEITVTAQQYENVACSERQEWILERQKKKDFWLNEGLEGYKSAFKKEMINWQNEIKDRFNKEKDHLLEDVLKRYPAKNFLKEYAYKVNTVASPRFYGFKMNENDWSIWHNNAVNELIEKIAEPRKKEIREKIRSLISPQPKSNARVVKKVQYFKNYYPLRNDIEITKGSNQFVILPTDPLLECFNLCPSYINPPYHDNDLTKPWEEEFLTNTLIPRLQEEASKRSKGMTEAWARQYKCAREFGLDSFHVFTCRICGVTSRGTRIFRLQSIMQHLRSQHQIYVRHADNIGVDAEEAIYHFWRS
ncbi:14187_t:CDS:2 [Ambispora leptoticha]|uniref:14187_t:CDS:1 n=1 Tax=Ambispora leptoticha TaxID=144679 RepID=A0A9N9AVL8_9GLOM|nr:14187_t:CDS:2 [Ambispora leptoticha]